MIAMKWLDLWSRRDIGLTSRAVITDPNDKNFDLEAYLTKLSAES